MHDNSDIFNNSFSSCSLESCINFYNTTSKHFFCDKGEEISIGDDQCTEGYYIIDLEDNIVAEVVRSAYNGNLYVVEPIDYLDSYCSIVKDSDVLYKFTNVSSYGMENQRLHKLSWIIDWFGESKDEDYIDISRLSVTCSYDCLVFQYV